ncbi:MAG: EF-P lysine aminoacylase EpmA [Planctomycetota bacterium]
MTQNIQSATETAFANMWRPTCSLPTLKARAAMLQATRDFFCSRGYLEVDTPCLSRDVVIDAWLEPMSLQSGGDIWYLQTSPEAHMKRLLAAGSGSIFQISRVFRSGESGARHNPEFTMVEWYGVDTTWRDQVALTEALVRSVFSTAADFTAHRAAGSWTSEPFRCTTYSDAFRRRFNINIDGCSRDELINTARCHQIALPEDVTLMSRDDVLNVMLGLGIEPSLGLAPDGTSSPEFLCDYPPTQAALAVTSESEPEVARRFELYINGIELCNGYQELTDADELTAREVAQNSIRTANGHVPLPGARRLIEAMRHGLPSCSGVALGFDRLAMIAIDASDVSEVMPFADGIA